MVSPQSGNGTCASHTGGGSFVVPFVQVNNKTVCTGDKCDYQVVANTIGSDVTKSPVVGAGKTNGSPNITYFFASR